MHHLYELARRAAFFDGFARDIGTPRRTVFPEGPRNGPRDFSRCPANGRCREMQIAHGRPSRPVPAGDLHIPCFSISVRSRGVPHLAFRGKYYTLATERSPVLFSHRCAVSRRDPARNDHFRRERGWRRKSHLRLFCLLHFRTRSAENNRPSRIRAGRANDEFSREISSVALALITISPTRVTRTAIFHASFSTHATFAHIRSRRDLNACVFQRRRRPRSPAHARLFSRNGLGANAYSARHIPRVRFSDAADSERAIYFAKGRPSRRSASSSSLSLPGRSGEHESGAARSQRPAVNRLYMIIGRRESCHGCLL